MKRKIYQTLLKWKKERKGEVALLIEGARRIGKSHIVEEFGHDEYESYILVDFSKVSPQVMEFFDLYLDDLDTLFLNLELYFRCKLFPRQSRGQEARSLIIFDEVQFCPRARSGIKHFVKDNRFDYIETGSLVSIKKNVKDIMIPSEEHPVQMYPMDFEEFLWAMGEEAIIQLIKNQFAKLKPLGLDMHRKAMTLFRQYMIVGGMPKAVDTYVKTRDFTKVDTIKRAIISLYRNDIQKYAEGNEVRVTSIFDLIPSQLQKHEKKFRLSEIKAGARMREYEGAFFWLNEAMVANICYGATEPNIGLNLKLENSSLKCYMADTGLLISMAFDENRIMQESLYKKLMMDKLEVNEGMLVENIVAQMLKAKGHKLFFYSNYSREAEDRMEIDFLIAKPSITSKHNISPIEVKSTNRYTISSLEKCVRKYKNYLSTPYVIHTSDLAEKDGIVYLPLYMTPLL